jgi:hypothetical protein
VRPLPTVAEICAKAAAVKFGEPLVVNTDRGFLVEVIVGEALSSEWRWLARDYGGWDFEHQTRCRLEVKHSAARQTWTSRNASVPSFDIKARTGHWEDAGATWIAAPGRQAQIYIFAHHPVIDDTADHRDAGQWRFYVVPTKLLDQQLPAAKTIHLDKVRLWGEEVGWGDLLAAVERQRLGLLFEASALAPTQIGAIAVPTFLRRETRWTGPVPASFASVPDKPPLEFEGEPIWAEFLVLRLLTRAGWEGVWVNSWKRAIWRDVMDPVELPADQGALFARIAQRSHAMLAETGKAAKGRWSGRGCWDIFAWRGAEVLFIESKQHERDCMRESQRIWLDSACAEGVSGFAIVEWKAD